MRQVGIFITKTVLRNKQITPFYERSFSSIIEPTEKIITEMLTKEINIDPFDGRGVESVDIGVIYPKSKYTKKEIEQTFSIKNEGYMQHEDKEFYSAIYSKFDPSALMDHELN